MVSMAFVPLFAFSFCGHGTSIVALLLVGMELGIFLYHIKVIISKIVVLY